MMGIGTPRSQSRIERPIAFLRFKGVGAGNRAFGLKFLRGSAKGAQIPRGLSLTLIQSQKAAAQAPINPRR